MIVTRPVATLPFAIGVLISTAAAAFDNGQWNDVPDHVRSWFKSVLSPSGVHCCDIADGHRTDWEIRPAGYFIPNPMDPTGEWIPVPPGAVVQTPAIRSVKRSCGGIRSLLMKIRLAFSFAVSCRATAYEHQTKGVTSTSRPPVLDDERSRLL